MHPSFVLAQDTRNIVIVGGGFAGTTLARALQRRLPAGHTVVMVSEESYTTFNPMLPEVVGAAIFPEQVVAPLRQVVDFSMGSRFLMGRVTGVDESAKRVTCTSLAGIVEIPYAELVLAFGSRASIDLVPGMADHALPLKNIGDAMEIRNRVLRSLARMEIETDPARRRVLGNFVVIGGGFSGVEVAGELVDCLKEIVRYYPRVDPADVKVTVVHSGDALLPELPAPLGIAARRSLERRGVDIRLNGRAAEIDAGGIRLKGGETIAAGTVICTIGTRANPLAEAIGVKTERGRIVAEPDLSLAGHAGLWAAGDCAQVVNAQDGKVAPPTAQYAVREALHLAGNIALRLEGRPTRPFDYRYRGSMASMGRLNGVAEVLGICVSGLPAWLLWRAYYLSQMPTLGRKVRIFVEWTWGMFFPADITHLHFRRSRDGEA
jgi:NADH dehydrogenase